VNNSEGVMKMEIVGWKRRDEYLNNQNFWYYDVRIRVNYDSGIFNGYNGVLYEIRGKSEKELEKLLLPQGNTTVYYNGNDVYGTIEYRISLGIVYEVFDAVDGQFFFMLDGHNYRVWEMSESKVIEYLNSNSKRWGGENENNENN